MLSHPTRDKLQSLRLSGRYQALRDQMHMPDIGVLRCEERLGLLVDRELTDRDERSHQRGLDVLSLATPLTPEKRGKNPLERR